jgi:hypothetical protein
MTEQWKGLDGPWKKYSEDALLDSKDQEVWHKDSPMLDVVLSHTTEDAWEVSLINSGEMVSHRRLDIRGNTVECLQEAQFMAMETATNFLWEGIDILARSGGEATPELRFKQITVVGGELFGLSEDGVVWEYEKTGYEHVGWIRKNMRRAH